MRLMAQTRNLDVTLRDSGFAAHARPGMTKPFFLRHPSDLAEDGSHLRMTQSLLPRHSGMRLMAQTRNLDVALRDSGFALRAPRNDA
jgi:hypothetical protein